jgi:hypothetical protein
MLAVYDDSAPSKYQVQYWSKQCKCSRKFIEDDPHPRRPLEVTTLEMCQKTKDLVMQDRLLKVNMIV